MWGNFELELLLVCWTKTEKADKNVTGLNPSTPTLAREGLKTAADWTRFTYSTIGKFKKE